MSAEADLKTLWQKEKATDMPQVEALLKKAAGIRQTYRKKVIIQTVVLMIIVAVMMVSALNIPHRQLTTNIGLALMIAGIILYLVATNQLLPMLFRTGIEVNSMEYVRQLIRIQQKIEYLRRVIIDIYFLLLTSGLYLYMLQFARRINLIGAILCYLLPSVCLAIAWSYSKRKEFSKTADAVADTIKKLEAINAQLINQDVIV